MWGGGEAGACLSEGAIATECNSRRHFAAAREGSSPFKDACDARHRTGAGGRPAAPPPTPSGFPGPQPPCAEVPAALSASPRPERPAASCEPSSTTSGGHDQDFAHSARKQRRKARHRHFAGSQNSRVEKDRDSVEILTLKHCSPRLPRPGKWLGRPSFLSLREASAMSSRFLGRLGSPLLGRRPTT